MAWTAVTGAEEYEFKLYDINRKYNVLQGNTSDPTITFKPPRTGVFEFSVRARQGSEYTEWMTFDARLSGWIEGVGEITIQ